MRNLSRVWNALGLLAFLSIVTASGEAVAQNAQKPSEPAQAQPVGPDPQTTTATYGDWIMACQNSPEGPGHRLCEISETLQVQGKGPIAIIIFTRANNRAPLKLISVLPVNVSFSSNVRMSADDKDTDAVDLTWQRCIAPRCFANTDMKDEILRHWRALADRGRIQFKDSDGRDVRLPFSFRGLSQALDALAKS